MAPVRLNLSATGLYSSAGLLPTNKIFSSGSTVAVGQIGPGAGGYIVLTLA
jgi:hypothetical protein